ncbi:hypothetical protein OROMI_024305 [Orobanche minor]
MKRPFDDDESTSAASDSGESAAIGGESKKIKPSGEGGAGKVVEMSKEAEAVLLDENLLYEVLRRVEDGPTLAKAASVSRQWRRTAHDERIWELICTRHYQRSPTQLRAVVSALGGFRRLYSSHLWPLLKPAAASSSAPIAAASSWHGLPPSPVAPAGAAKSKARWGKDEFQLNNLPAMVDIVGAERWLQDVIHMHPFQFVDAMDPVGWEDWINEINKIFVAVNCPEACKVSIAQYFLTRDVASWWRTVASQDYEVS